MAELAAAGAKASRAAEAATEPSATEASASTAEPTASAGFFGENDETHPDEKDLKCSIHKCHPFGIWL